VDPTIIIPIMIALIPCLIALIILCRTSFNYWLSAILGGSGWFIALLIRAPILAYFQNLGFHGIVMSSIMAGVFEESIRYFITWYKNLRKIDLRSSISIGLGWGLTEAVIIYALQVPVASITRGYEWTAFIPGAIERNIAIVFHLSMTLLLLVAIVRRFKLLLLIAIFLHVLLNVVGVFTMLMLGNPWITECIIALLVLMMIVPIMIYVRKNIPS